MTLCFLTFSYCFFFSFSFSFSHVSNRENTSRFLFERERELFMPVSGVEKRRFGIFLAALGVIWRGKAFREQQCQFLTRNKSLSSENESNCSMACTTRVRKTKVRTTPVRSQQCECQQCERDNSANETRVRMSKVRMPAVRCDIGAKKVRKQCERQQCESLFLSFCSKRSFFVTQKEFFLLKMTDTDFGFGLNEK